MTLAPSPFYRAGSVTDQINVAISFQIIGLFSEGLYSSPNKAIEELVSNAFDADATSVHTVLSPDRAAPDSSIAVIDNGTGMDENGLKVHWIVGDSPKSGNRVTNGGRRTIGKFGIGKLAAYVLGERLTHITKSGGKFYSTSMDFRTIPKPPTIQELTGSQIPAVPPVILELRELTEVEARSALQEWMTQPNGRPGLSLFGEEAEDSWTAAIITDLKPMASDLTAGRLRWVLSTAMPLRDDFELYLNGQAIKSSKETVKSVGSWMLGKEIKKLPSPGPSELDSDIDSSLEESDYRHWMLIDSLIGPLTGYVEVYQDPIDTGKSEEIVGRSNGFFVYVNGRLINPDDSGFGIDRNSLRHGTFSRFRVVVNIDRLDKELRSSRENLLDSPSVKRAKDILQGLFNFARTKLGEHEAAEIQERRASQRFADSPASLTERPLLRMIADAYEGRITPRHIKQIDKSIFTDAESVIEHVKRRIESDPGLIAQVSYADLGMLTPMAVLDVTTGILAINLDHPFVAHFADEFGDQKKNLPLELFAMADVLLEAELNDAEISLIAMNSVLDSRDELLRTLAKSSGARNSLTVAQALINSASSAKGLELAVVDAFTQLGFQAVPKAGKDEADGIAEAFLGVKENGLGTYKVSLEAKSKETPGGKVKKQAVEISTIARHRDEANCDHAIVVGPEFETGADNLGAVMREIAADRLNNPGKTITLIRIRDLARLVRIAPTKRLNLEQIRNLFQSSSPDDASKWVDDVEGSHVDAGPHQAILEVVWEMQHKEKEDTINYGSLKTALYYERKISISIIKLKTECLALSRMAPGLFFYGEDRVELNIHPDKVLDTIHSYIDNLPREID